MYISYIVDLPILYFLNVNMENRWMPRSKNLDDERNWNFT